MTTVADTTRATSVAARGRTATGTVTLARVAAAELVKLRSTRSLLAAAVTTAVLVVGTGAFAAVGALVQESPEAAADPLSGALTGISPATWAVATLGVVAVTGEYATGTIKPTLAAVPRRAQLVAGKAVALAATTLVIGLLSVLTAFVTAQAIVSAGGIDLSFTSPGAPRVLVGSALYLTGTVVVAAALGWLLRSTAGALAALFGIFAVLPVVGYLLPHGVAAAILPYLPGNAGTAIMQVEPGGQLGPWTGLAVFTGSAALAAIGAAVVLRRRDA